MTLEQIWTTYIPEYLHLVLPLAALLGLLFGLIIGRRTARPKTAVQRERESLDEIFDEVTRQPEEKGDVSVSADGIGNLAGISQKHISALASVGITSVDKLVGKTASKKEREALADELQLEDFVVNKWARMASLMQIPDVSSEVAEFLVYFGINSPADLASRNADSMAHKMQNLNEEEQRISSVPTRAQLESWISHIQNQSA